MKFHAQLLKQGFSNCKEPLVREEILLPGQGTHSHHPTSTAACSGGQAQPGKAVTGTAQAQTLLWSAQGMGGTQLSLLPLRRGTFPLCPTPVG